MNGSSITGANPIIITSGTMNELVNMQNSCVRQFYWEQPDLSSTSSVVIRKKNMSGQIYNHMTCEVSGQSQIQRVDMWCDTMFVDCMPCGTLYIYTK